MARCTGDMLARVVDRHLVLADPGDRVDRIYHEGIYIYYGCSPFWEPTTPPGRLFM
jgi:hypothetical protein